MGVWGGRGGCLVIGVREKGGVGEMKLAGFLNA